MGLRIAKEKVGTYPLQPGTYPLLKNNFLCQKKLNAAEKWVQVSGGMSAMKGVTGL